MATAAAQLVEQATWDILHMPMLGQATRGKIGLALRHL